MDLLAPVRLARRAATTLLTRDPRPDVLRHPNGVPTACPYAREPHPEHWYVSPCENVRGAVRVDCPGIPAADALDDAERPPSDPLTDLTRLLSERIDARAVTKRDFRPPESVTMHPSVWADVLIDPAAYLVARENYPLPGTRTFADVPVLLAVRIEPAVVVLRWPDGTETVTTLPSVPVR